jgi:hypothetical protein
MACRMSSNHYGDRTPGNGSQALTASPSVRQLCLGYRVVGSFGPSHLSLHRVGRDNDLAFLIWSTCIVQYSFLSIVSVTCIVCIASALLSCHIFYGDDHLK